VAGVIVLGLGGTVGFLALTGDEGGSKKSSATVPLPKGEKKATKKRKPAAPPIDPSTVTVAVLNGTTIAGLAAQVGEEATADGFTLGTVTNAARTDQTKSQVLYRKGQTAAADLVAKRLGIRSSAPVDTLSAELAGSFDVVVLVGTDRAS
jgi:hypothetical protein